MVSPLLVQFGLPFLVQVLSEALNKIDSPVAQSASESLGKVQDAFSVGKITPEQLAEANRHAESMAMLQAEEVKAAYTQVNESLRAEVASDDAYVRRMRPTFGYLMALTWTAQMLALAYVMTFRTEQAYIVLGAMDSLAAIWAMGLSVLGIYVYKRSEDKKISSPPILSAITPKAPPLPRPKPALSPDKSRLNE